MSLSEFRAIKARLTKLEAFEAEMLAKIDAFTADTLATYAAYVKQVNERTETVGKSEVVVSEVKKHIEAMNNGNGSSTEPGKAEVKAPPQNVRQRIDQSVVRQGVQGRSGKHR